MNSNHCSSIRWSVLFESKPEQSESILARSIAALWKLFLFFSCLPFYLSFSSFSSRLCHHKFITFFKNSQLKPKRLSCLHTITNKFEKLKNNKKKFRHFTAKLLAGMTIKSNLKLFFSKLKIFHFTCVRFTQK